MFLSSELHPEEELLVDRLSQELPEADPWGLDQLLQGEQVRFERPLSFCERDNDSALSLSLWFIDWRLSVEKVWVNNTTFITINPEPISGGALPRATVPISLEILF